METNRRDDEEKVLVYRTPYMPASRGLRRFQFCGSRASRSELELQFEFGFCFGALDARGDLSSLGLLLDIRRADAQLTLYFL